MDIIYLYFCNLSYFSVSQYIHNKNYTVTDIQNNRMLFMIILFFIAMFRSAFLYELVTDNLF